MIFYCDRLKACVQNYKRKIESRKVPKYWKNEWKGECIVHCHRFMTLSLDFKDILICFSFLGEVACKTQIFEFFGMFVIQRERERDR